LRTVFGLWLWRNRRCFSLRTTRIHFIHLCKSLPPNENLVRRISDFVWNLTSRTTQ
jgi:hypothetical protein